MVEYEQDRNCMILFNLDHIRTPESISRKKKTKKTLKLIYVEELYVYVYIYIIDIVDIQS